MKMPDGGFRPAYNIQLATDGDSGVIVGVEVVNTADSGQAAPMEEQVVQRTGEHPKCYLMDGGFATREDITTLERRGVTVYAPVRLPRNKPGEERYQARYEDSPEVVADGYRGGQGDVPATRLHRRMGQRPGASAWGVPIQRAGAGQSQHRHAPGSGGP